ncbi:MAG: acyloxyacyl hydrolase [Gammaproteobacteria bacterium]|nr:MAG: acyloxyacyl hydrolase [Gammaproteobacteria bacterium]
MHLISITVILILTFFSKTAFAIDRFDFAVGSVSRPSLDAPLINSFRAGFSWDTDYLQSQGDDYFRTLRIETSVGLNRTHEKDIKDIGVSPILHYKLKRSNWPDFIEIGVGITHISETHWKPYNDMGSHLQFADRISAGYYVGTTEISFNLYHISNGGLSRPNPGADMLLMRMSFKL